jgi:DNA-binding response OmpR family regulator
MSVAAEDTYTVTFDPDPASHTAIAAATGVQSKWAASAADLDKLQDLQPVAVFLDVRLGVDHEGAGGLIPRLKEAWPTSPIILTGCDTAGPELLTEGVALGADDFVCKEIGPAELMRRVEIRRSALARRAARETIAFGDLTIDTLQRSVTSARGQKFLSPTEIKLLAELAKAGGGVVPRDTLKTRCWPHVNVSDNALNRKLYEIRRRLKPICEGINIRTIYGVGFVMEQR